MMLNQMRVVATKLPWVFFLIVGFLIGRLTSKNQPTSKIEKTQIHNEIAKTQQVETHAKVEKNEMATKIEHVVKVVYDKSGKVHSRTEKTLDYGYHSQVNSNVKKDEAQKTIVKQDEKIEKKLLQSDNNWQMAAFIPVKSTLDLTNVHMSVSYRILGNLSIVGMTNVKFNQFYIGPQFQF